MTEKTVKEMPVRTKFRQRGTTLIWQKVTDEEAAQKKGTAEKAKYAGYWAQCVSPHKPGWMSPPFIYNFADGSKHKVLSEPEPLPAQTPVIITDLEPGEEFLWGNGHFCVKISDEEARESGVVVPARQVGRFFRYCDGGATEVGWLSNSTLVTRVIPPAEPVELPEGDWDLL